MNKTIENKIETLIEEAQKEVVVGSNELQAAAWNAMTPEEQNKYRDPGNADIEGVKGIGKSLFQGALLGGLVGVGGAVANETLDTNIDPVISGLATAGLTGALNAPGKFAERKEDFEEFRNNTALRNNKELQNSEKTLRKNLMSIGYNDAEFNDLKQSLRREFR